MDYILYNEYKINIKLYNAYKVYYKWIMIIYYALFLQDINDEA